MRELSLHILDVVENSLQAGASRIELLIDEKIAEDLLRIIVEDNGRGMTSELLERISDPFFTTRTTRHVGLGIPLLKAAAERCGGGLNITSEPAKGTRLEATFQHSHIDRAPLGNIVGALMAILLSGTSCDLHYVHRLDGQQFEFDTEEIRAELDDLPLAHPAVRRWLQESIAAGEMELMQPGTT